MRRFESSNFTEDGISNEKTARMWWDISSRGLGKFDMSETATEGSELRMEREERPSSDEYDKEAVLSIMNLFRMKPGSNYTASQVRVSSAHERLALR